MTALLLLIPPYGAIIVFALFNGHHADRKEERCAVGSAAALTISTMHFLVPIAISIASMIVLVSVPASMVWLRYAGLIGMAQSCASVQARSC